MSYVELHSHSAFSFGDGASSPQELAEAAAARGYEAMAITDHDGVWGAMEFAQACEPLGVRAIAGAELTIHSGDPTLVEGERPNCPAGCFHLTLLVASEAGWSNLCRLLTAAHRDTRPKPGREPLPPAVSLDELEQHTDGLVCLSGCAAHGAPPRLFPRLLAAFGPDDFRIELQRPFWRDDNVRNRRLAEQAKRLGVPTVATGNVHMHERSRAALQDTLVATRLGLTLEESEPQRRGNSSAYLASPEQMAARFCRYPDAVTETAELAERLRFDLCKELAYRYPGSEDPGADRALSEICRTRLEHRYSGLPEHREASRRLEEELGVIRGLRLSGFFLLHHDILELAREVAIEVRGRDSARMLLPPGRGRGSSVSSVVCYLTGLSHIDPVKGGLFLGRFLNEEITEAPDIDLDFPRDIRERLIPRIHRRYGNERSALVAAFACYRSKAGVRDFGKALGLPAGEIERVARTVDVHARPDHEVESVGLHDAHDWLLPPRRGGLERDLAEVLGESRARSVRWRALVRLVQESWGLPRHASQHPGGMILSTRPLIDICPVQPASMAGRQIAQWDKDSCADAGFLKIDLLGLGMLSAVERAVDEIARTRGERIDLSRIPLDDPQVYDTIQRADTTGVFQIESRAQMQMLTRTLPESLDDITVQVALVRPGPIQGGAVNPYIQRKERLREDPGYEIPYEHPALEPILSDTLGTIVFQEQVIQVAMALAGFSAGEAEGLRRAMSRKRSEAAILAYKERFISGAQERGVELAVAERVFDQVKGFSGFGFPKAHAAAFGLLAYQSTWLRVHYYPELLASLLNEQPMGFYPPDPLVHDAQRRGLTILPPDVNHSLVECCVEPDLAHLAAYPVRIGLGYVDGIKDSEMEILVAERERGGFYADLGDLASRSGISRDALQKLAWTGACAGLEGFVDEVLGDSRRRALWRSGIARGSKKVRGGEQLSLPLEVGEAPGLRKLSDWDVVVADYESTGMSIGDHPMKLIRPSLEVGYLSSAELGGGRHGESVRVAGLVTAKQRPATAKGITFMTLEDEFGTINLIVPRPVYERHRLAVRTAPMVRARGRLELHGVNVNVLVSELHQLQRPDLPLADVRTIEPSVGRETGREIDELQVKRVAVAGLHNPEPGIDPSLADLTVALPKGHSFGRRGR